MASRKQSHARSPQPRPASSRPGQTSRDTPGLALDAAGARRRPRDDRIGRRGRRAGLPDPHLRGRGLCDPHRLDGPGLDGGPQGPGMSRVRLPLPGQRQRHSRGKRRIETRPGQRGHLPHVPRPGHVLGEVQSVLCRRPRAGGQILLPVEAAGALGRGRVPLSRRRLEELHQAPDRAARRDPLDQARRLVDAAQRPARRALPHRPQAAGKTAGHARTGLRQRLHAGHCPLGQPATLERRRLAVAGRAAVRDRRHGARRRLAALSAPRAFVSTRPTRGCGPNCGRP